MPLLAFATSPNIHTLLLVTVGAIVMVGGVCFMLTTHIIGQWWRLSISLDLAVRGARLWLMTLGLVLFQRATVCRLLCNYVNHCLNLPRKERVQEAFVLQLDRGIQVVYSASFKVVVTRFIVSKLQPGLQLFSYCTVCPLWKIKCPYCEHIMTYKHALNMLVCM